MYLRHRSGWILVAQRTGHDLRHDVVLAPAPASFEWVRPLRFRLVMAILAIVTASCGSETTNDEVSLVSQTAAGGQIDFNALEGTDTVLWFWAPW